MNSPDAKLSPPLTQTAPAPVTAGALPWYKSPQEIGLVTTAVSALVAIFPKVGQLLGLSSPSDAATAVSNVFAFIAVIAPAVGAVLRWRSKEQPLTSSQKAADEHPATIAVVQTQTAMRQVGIPTAVERQKLNTTTSVQPKQELHL